MTDPNEPSFPSAPESAPDVVTLQADLDKWKALARTNEKRWNEVSAERDQLKTAGMTDTEKAIETARTEARNATLAEVNTRLVDAEMRIRATSAGVSLPDSATLNLNHFTGADGSPDGERIQAFVSSLTPAPQAPAYAQDLGMGRQGDSGYTAGQLGREAMARMTPKEINDARKAGRLDALMKGELS